jgi:hypothetical protein
MCAPISGQASISRPDAAHPGRIRFLHRFPAGVRGGTSCFSREAYALRKWQLLTCVKDGSAMRLYIDGNLTAEINDANELPQHLRVLIGQLHPYSAVRPAPVSPFVGEMDEVAIYDRALTEAEIESHYQLVQNNSHGS